MKIGILSDIHGNRVALMAVLKDLSLHGVEGIILLGDVIDYGPHSNEVIQLLREHQGLILCNIHGNHENAILDDRYDRFSSDRGRHCAKYTRECLTEDSWNYIKNTMTNSGKEVIEINCKKIMAVHGSLADNYWKAISVDDNLDDYFVYDYVFSGHSHLPHFFEKYYKVDDLAHRNKKKTIFVNPGSVGQPRNLCPCAQYAIWETECDTFEMRKVPYDIFREQQDFSAEVDVFYKNRLEAGI